MPSRVVGALGAVLVATGVAVLLARLLFAATAQSFDTMIYARGLWGLAHLDWSNPVLGVPTLAVHAHGLLLLLAPLARIFDPTALLVAAQAVAIGASVYLAACAASDVFERPLVRGGVAMMACVLLVPASPFLANPALFDARPDLAGVPFALAALLRARRRGEFDRTALVLGWFAIAMREEFALLTLVPAVLIAPLEKMSARRRAVIAAPMLLYWLIYWFVLRDVFGQQAATVEMSSYSRLWLTLPSGTTWTEIVPHKVELAGAALATGGGLALLGRRWLVAALVPVTFVLVTHRLQSLQLNFHYPLFAAPLLIVASIAGLEHVRRWSIGHDGRVLRARAAAIGVVVAAVGAVTFVQSSAWPGGGRWRAPYFAVSEVSRARHEVLAQLDADVGIAVPYEIGAPVSDRDAVWTTIRLAQHLREQNRVPAELDVVVVTRAELAGVGQKVAAEFGDAGEQVAPSDLTVYRRRSVMNRESF